MERYTTEQLSSDPVFCHFYRISQIPHGGEILAALALCKVPFKTWAQFPLPWFLIWWIVAFIFLIYAARIGYGPF